MGMFFCTPLFVGNEISYFFKDNYLRQRIKYEVFALFL